LVKIMTNKHWKENKSYFYDTGALIKE
jgi:hypothetical protein